MTKLQVTKSLADVYSSHYVGVLSSQSFYHKDSTVEGKISVSKEPLNKLCEKLEQMVTDNILELNRVSLFSSIVEFLNVYHKVFCSVGEFHTNKEFTQIYYSHDSLTTD